MQTKPEIQVECFYTEPQLQQMQEMLEYVKDVFSGTTIDDGFEQEYTGICYGIVLACNDFDEYGNSVVNTDLAQNMLDHAFETLYGRYANPFKQFGHCYFQGGSTGLDWKFRAEKCKELIQFFKSMQEKYYPKKVENMFELKQLTPEACGFITVFNFIQKNTQQLLTGLCGILNSKSTAAYSYFIDSYDLHTFGSLSYPIEFAIAKNNKKNTTTFSLAKNYEKNIRNGWDMKKPANKLRIWWLSNLAIAASQKKL